MKNKEKRFNINSFVKALLLLVLLLSLFFPLSYFVAPYRASLVADYVFSHVLKIDKTPLIGVSNIVVFKKPTMATLKSGEFQRGFEDYFLRRANLYKYLVKINNELSLRLFKQISFLYGQTDVFLGNDDQLLQKMYLNSFNRRKTPGEFALQKHAIQVGKLSSLLKKKGILLLIVVNPNALSLYPELVPNRYVDPTRFERKNSYELEKEYLISNNVIVVDNYEYLLNKKDEIDFHFFEKTGSHLNDIGSCFGTNNIIDNINKYRDFKIKNFPCLPRTMRFPPVNKDKDLLDVVNLAYPEKRLVSAPYSPDTGKLYENPPLNILFVGTSFNFAVQDILTKKNIANSKLYFYYKSLRDKNGIFHVLRKNEIDWGGDVFKNDVIILESNYSGLGGVGYDFVKHAIKKLKMSIFKNKQELKAWESQFPKIKAKRRGRGRRQKVDEEFNPFAGHE